MILIEEVNRYGTTLAYNHDHILVGKSCGKCGELKALKEFHKTKQCKLTGTVSTCRRCIKEFHHKHYRKNRKKYLTNYDSDGSPISRECSKCKVIQPITQFHPHKKGKDGFNSYCMDCTSVQGKEYRQKIPDKIKKRSQRYYSRNCGKIKTNSKIRIKRVRKQKAFYKNFENEISEVYKQAELLNQNSETKYVVDHIIPLNHPTVCGLHYHENMRVIPESINCSKRNKWDGTSENTNWEFGWRKTLTVTEESF